jgi:hypothetical protein
MDNLDATNPLGIYRRTFVSNKTTKKHRNTCYYAFTPGRVIENKNDVVLGREENLCKLVQEYPESTEAVRKRKLECLMGPTTVVSHRPRKLPPPVPTSLEIYWSSPEARILFCGPRKEEGDEVSVAVDVKAVIQSRLQRLETAINIDKGWQAMIEGGDPQNLCTYNEIRVIRLQCLYLYKALSIALEKMPEWKHFGKCCQEAIHSLSQNGVRLVKSVRTVLSLHRMLKEKDGQLPHPRARRDGTSAEIAETPA